MLHWNIETKTSVGELERFLADNAPWRIGFSFNGEMDSAAFGVREPFNQAPLRKLSFLTPFISESAFAGRVLDVGSNIGYNSIYLAQRGGAVVTGIDNNRNNVKIANCLAQFAGVDSDFRIANAEIFRTDEPVDLVLHLGTLYHLPNPHLALRTSAENLKPGGWIALETTAYIAGNDPLENLWINGFNGDKTNFWALSKPTIEAMLENTSFTNIQLVKEFDVPVLAGRMSRVIYVAQRR